VIAGNAKGRAGSAVTLARRKEALEEHMSMTLRIHREGHAVGRVDKGSLDLRDSHLYKEKLNAMQTKGGRGQGQADVMLMAMMPACRSRKSRSGGC
jgi:hypothetical protein